MFSFRSYHQRTLLPLCLMAVIFSVLFSSCQDQAEENNSTPEPAPIQSIGFKIVSSFPHDTNAFTEGFFLHENKFYESTGATKQFPQTRSLLGILDTTTGKIEKKAELNKDQYFGEGIILLKDKIYQLTYTTKVGFIYDAHSYKKIGEFTIPSAEGWGMTTDGTHLLMSDGTNKIFYLDPNTLQVVKTLFVTENGYAKDKLNELEYVNGFIYANIFTTQSIVKIDPTQGDVVGVIDLNVLHQEALSSYPFSQEMNGIAFDANKKIFYVTGKLWPKVFAIQLNSL